MAGPLVRLACERHLRDLKDGPDRGLVWDWPAAQRAINFFPDVLRLTEGNFAGKPFNLQLWQQFVVGSLFGWKRADGYRRFGVCYAEIGKGNGKSPMIGGIGLYMVAADGEQGAECYAAAVTRDQAGIMFRDAVHMRDASPALTNRLLKSGKRVCYNMAHLASSSFFRPISSEGRSLDGKRVHFAGVDEIHEHPSSMVWDKLRLGTKGRNQALVAGITNSGFDRQTICWELHDYGKRVLEGVVEDDGFFAYICALDDGDEPFEDEECWIKANPNLGVSVPKKYLADQVREAKGMPSKRNIVMRLNFCCWTDAADAWISKELWDAVQADLNIEDYYGLPCTAALDLSGKRDLTALALVFETEEGLDAFTWFWTPEEDLRDRADTDQVPYDIWRDEGHLEVTPGRSVNYRWVAGRMIELAEDHNIEVTAFDPYRIADLERELDDMGVDLKLMPHGQGFGGGMMPRAVDALEGAILNGNIRIKNNPVLTWNAASAVLESDHQENRKFSKRRATGRIDGIVALAMAVNMAESKEVAGPSLELAILERGGFA